MKQAVRRSSQRLDIAIAYVCIICQNFFAALIPDLRRGCKDGPFTAFGDERAHRANGR
jgi:hypothetical protein